MSNFQYTSDIVADVLFRSGELMDGTSPALPGVIQFINRAYNSLCMGGGEFNSGQNEEWWWLHKDPPGVMVLEAPITTGTVAVTNNNPTITLSSAPATTKAGWFFRTDDHGDVFRISTHAGGAATAVLDSVYTGESATLQNYRLFKTEYDLASDVFRIISPMSIQHGGHGPVEGVELSTMSRDYPYSHYESGAPNQFAQVTESKIRFNRYGTDIDGALIRVEYDYLARPATLTNAANEEPVVPRQYRQILADIAYYYILQAKSAGSTENATKLANIGGLIKNSIKSMSRENRHRMIIHGSLMGRITPRGRGFGTGRYPLRTESGMILG